MTGMIRLAPALLAALALSAVVTPARAQAAEGTGEVRRIDAAAGKVTIQQGAISALDLPAMTLVYRTDPKLLAGIQVGQQVAFTVERRDGKYVITAISPT